jgi:RimJ/RimL family protein N-acetyltransferase
MTILWTNPATTAHPPPITDEPETTDQPPTAGPRSAADRPGTADRPGITDRLPTTRRPSDRLAAARPQPIGSAAHRASPGPGASAAAPLVPPAVAAADGGAKVLRVGETTVRLRPVAPHDGAALAAVLERMSLRTRWLRFHSPITRFSAAQLRMLLEADQHDRAVLVAEIESGRARWQLIGFAQYARIAPDRADAAIVLEDAWQGRGIGRALALELVATARAAGVAAFTSEILTENHRTLKFARALAPRHTGRLLGITTELTVWLDPA